MAHNAAIILLLYCLCRLCIAVIVCGWWCLIFIYLFLFTCLSGEVWLVVHCVKERGGGHVHVVVSVSVLLLLLLVHRLGHHVGHGGLSIRSSPRALLAQVVDERKPEQREYQIQQIIHISLFDNNSHI